MGGGEGGEGGEGAGAASASFPLTVPIERKKRIVGLWVGDPGKRDQLCFFLWLIVAFLALSGCVFCKMLFYILLQCIGVLYFIILCNVLYNYCSAEEIPHAQYCKMLYVVEKKKILL